MLLKHSITMVWRWLRLISTLSVLVGLCVYTVSSQSTPLYRAQTTVMIGQSRANDGRPDYESLLANERLANTYAEVLSSRPIIDEVQTRVHSSVPFETLKPRIRVSIIRNTQLIKVSVDDNDPVRAAALANEIINVFSVNMGAQQTSRYATARQGLQAEMASVQAKIDQTQQALDRLPQATVSQSMGERSRLEVRLTQDHDAYTTLLQSYETLRVTELQATNSIEVVEQALPPLQSISPRPLQNGLLTGLIAALLCSGCVVVWQYFNVSIATAMDAGQLLNTPVLASIETSAMLPPTNVMSGSIPGAEAYRLLRLAIETAEGATPVRTLAILSSGSDASTSTISAHFAIALAQAGRRVVLVDANIQHPALHDFFQRVNTGGLSSVLLESSADIITDGATHVDVPQLTLVPAGPAPSSTVDLLANPRLPALIATLKNHSDIVLLRCSSALLADGLLVARACDAALLLVEKGTLMSQAQQATAHLAHAGVRLLGVVFTHSGNAHNSLFNLIGRGQPVWPLFRRHHDHQQSLPPAGRSADVS